MNQEIEIKLRICVLEKVRNSINKTSSFFLKKKKKVASRIFLRANRFSSWQYRSAKVVPREIEIRRGGIGKKRRGGKRKRDKSHRVGGEARLCAGRRERDGEEKVTRERPSREREREGGGRRGTGRI